jgi:hypothetical protein
MAKYLITTTEVYRVDSEGEVEAVIAEAKADENFVLTKYNREYKERKQKGEVIDSYYKVSLVKAFTEEKDPIIQTTVTYEVE